MSSIPKSAKTDAMKADILIKVEELQAHLARARRELDELVRLDQNASELFHAAETASDEAQYLEGLKELQISVVPRTVRLCRNVVRLGLRQPDSLS